ncbi:MAG: addiction module antidote protein, HigA family [Acidobacteria bacterium RIFCSPLOWO2_12_FULL_60_22]|nr:MAG: addiction module antidote protein, HigA family [Acidobacteria bacterium RIFCSPLOWO2_12_FULL_60_22]
MPMKNPPHPGGLIRRQVIQPLGLSVSRAAAVLGVTRQALSLLLNERTDLSLQMALRIEKAFGPKMDHLMRMQLAYNLAAQRAQEDQIRVKRYQHTENVHA